MSKKTTGGTQPTKVQCVWGHLCSLTSIDQERNNVSLFNVIEQLNLPAKLFEDAKKAKNVAIISLNYEVVLNFRRIVSIDVSDPIGVEMKLSLIDPTGKAIQETILPIAFNPGSKRLRTRVRMKTFTLTTEGDYVYRVDIKETPESDFITVLNIPIEAVSKS